MTTTQIGILVLVFVGLALVLAVVIDRFNRWIKWRKIIHAVEQPMIRRAPDDLRNIPSPARPKNVMTLNRRKPPPKAA